MDELTDSSIMKFGTHKGKRLVDIPDQYFQWWYNCSFYRPYSEGSFQKQLIKYIEDNAETILK
jgi:uncharacterized protein (DUF3820 family)